MWKKVVSKQSSANSHSVASFSSITAGLADFYKSFLLPLENDYKFAQFYSPIMTEGDFKAKPMVLLVGQYSTGKTTFVRHLLEKDYPGLRIGPEPTTDKFVAVCHSDKMLTASNIPQATEKSDNEIMPPQVLPGHAAVVDRSLPWSQLENFGPGFLSRFEVVHVNSSVFKGVTLIDTPGVLAGNKQWERGYDFEGVIKWFAERVDLVLLFFDAHKLDISDEFRRCIQALKGNDSKVCILLNKADSVSSQQLMRVYGALMWSLGKVMPAPEVPKIHIGSFWDQPLQNEESRKLFEAESDDLFKMIFSLPARSAARKIDDFLKRVRLCRVHCILMDYLRKQMPYVGKSAKQRELINNLEEIFQILAKQHHLPLTDFPPADEVRKHLIQVGDFHKFPKLDGKRIRDLEEVLQQKIAALTRLIPKEEARGFAASRPGVHLGGLSRSPFFSEVLDTTRSVPKEAVDILEPEIQNMDLPPWAFKKYLMTGPEVHLYKEEFEQMQPDINTGLVSGSQAKPWLEKSKLPTSVLHRIWNLADVTKDGYLNIYEYAMARHFVNMKMDGFELPPFLPACLISAATSGITPSTLGSETRMAASLPSPYNGPRDSMGFDTTGDSESPSTQRYDREVDQVVEFRSNESIGGIAAVPLIKILDNKWSRESYNSKETVSPDTHSSRLCPKSRFIEHDVVFRRDNSIHPQISTTDSEVYFDKWNSEGFLSVPAKIKHN